MKLDLVVMIMLRARPRSGYDIKRWVDREGKFEGLDRHASQIYRTLAKLEAQGLVTYVVEERLGVPNAKVYRLSAAGEARLDEWLYERYAPTAVLGTIEFLWRVKGLAAISPKDARQVVEIELNARKRQVAENRGRDREFGPDRRADGTVDAVVLFEKWLDLRGMDRIDDEIVQLERLAATLRAAEAEDTTGTSLAEGGLR